MEDTLDPDRGQKQRSLELVTKDSRLGAQFPSLESQFRRRTGGYLQVTGGAVPQHAGDNGPFIEIFAIGFGGLPHASTSEDVQEST